MCNAGKALELNGQRRFYMFLLVANLPFYFCLSVFFVVGYVLVGYLLTSSERRGEKGGWHKPQILFQDKNTNLIAVVV